MKTISSWRDLEEFGIVYLTGESCGISYRMLCDVTEDGLRILREMLGLSELKLNGPWNVSTRGKKHVGSIMLSNEMIAPIAVFALLDNGYAEVWLLDDRSVLGIPAERLEAYEEHFNGNVLRKFKARGTAGLRNTHVMSGRVS